MTETSEIVPTPRTELVPTRRVPATRRVPLPRRPVDSRTRRWLRDLVALPVVESYLSPGEQCLIATRRHWLVPLLAMAQGGAMMAVIGVLSFLLPQVFLVQLALGIGAVAHTGYIGWCVLDWRHEQVAVTDRRIIRVSGVLTTTVDAAPLSQITDSTLHRSILGRIFGYGSIRIETAGQKQGVERLNLVPWPDDFYRATLI